MPSRQCHESGQRITFDLPERHRYYGALLGELSESDQLDAVRIVRLLAQAMKRLRASVPACCGATQDKPKRTDVIAEGTAKGRSARRQDNKKGVKDGV